MSHTVTLTWAESDTVQGFNVYRGSGPLQEGMTPINGATLVPTATYTDTVAGPGTYDYFVTAVENGVESAHSNEAQAVVLPAAPTNLVAKVS